MAGARTDDASACHCFGNAPDGISVQSGNQTEGKTWWPTDSENPKTENPTGEPYTGGTAFDLVNVAGGRVCFVRHNRDPSPIDSHPTLRASLANGLNPNYCFQSANILRGSCVCLGVSGVRNDE
jgi:hypothetical protein